MPIISVFIVRICLLPLRNPLGIDNLLVFNTFDEAYKYSEKFITTNKLTMRKNNIFDSNNRYYIYENFIEEEYIWIEKHEI